MNTESTNTRNFVHRGSLFRCAWLLGWGLALAWAAAQGADLRLGIIGIDSSHSGKFAEIFNDPKSPQAIPGVRIVCGFKGGSADVERSLARVEKFSAELRDNYGVTLVDSIPELVARCDAILILSVDGRAHLPQAREVFGAGKPVFIDKPLGGSLADSIQIAQLARSTGTPLLSCSNYRFNPVIARIKGAGPGRLRGVMSYSPATLEPAMPDLYFYAVHATEALYTLLGPGCVSVARVSTPDSDIVTGVWNDGRTGVLYGLRNGKPGNGVTVFGAKTIVSESLEADFPTFAKQLVEFFKTGVSPVQISETLEMMAFMEAADESKRRGGAPVAIAEVLKAGEKR